MTTRTTRTTSEALKILKSKRLNKRPCLHSGGRAGGRGTRRQRYAETIRAADHRNERLDLVLLHRLNIIDDFCRWHPHLKPAPPADEGLQLGPYYSGGHIQAGSFGRDEHGNLVQLAVQLVEAEDVTPIEASEQPCECLP